MKKLAIFVLFVNMIVTAVVAQSVLSEKRIYLMDITASMSGVEGNEDIIDSVKSQMISAVQELDPTTEIVVVPFTKNIKDVYTGDYNEICQSIKSLDTKAENTNLIAAWNKGLSLLDSTKTNYLFFLTDGVHNTSPKEEFYNCLSMWPDYAKGKPYYTFYLMLTHNAKDERIRQISDSLKQMWNIESLNINTTIVNADPNEKTVNVFYCKNFNIPIRCNHPELLSEIPDFSFELENNPYYEIVDSRLSSISALSKAGFLSFSIKEKVPKYDIPDVIKLSAYVQYNKEEAPLVFFTPEEYQFQLENYGQKIIDFCLSDCDDSLFFDLGTHNFKEPFTSILASRPFVLERSLNYYPFKWFTPDTVIFDKHLSVRFNEECTRFGVSQEFFFVDKHNHPLRNLEIESDGRVTNNGSFWISLDKGDTIYCKDFTLRFKIPASMGDTLFEGGIVVNNKVVDKINGKVQGFDPIPFTTFRLEQKIQNNWVIWILWLVCLLIALLLVYRIFKIIVLALLKLIKYYLAPASECLNAPKEDLPFKTVDYSQAYLDYLNKKFEKLTKLSDTDIAFVVLATALQTGRWVLSRKLFGDLGTSSIERISATDGDKLKHPIQNYFQDKFKNYENVKGKYPSWEEILWGTYLRSDGKKSKGCCPYDAQKNAPEWFRQGGMGTHRSKTLGHDPVLGWIFGPANLMTQTITLTRFDTYKVIFPGNEFGEEINTVCMLGDAIESMKEHPLRLPAALIAHYAHLKSDIFTSAGLPIPISGMLYSQKRENWVNELAGDLYLQKYDFLKSLQDCGRLAQDAFWAEMINMFIVLVHGMFYDKNIDGKKQYYEYRTTKIIDISNAVSSTGNILYSAFTQQWGKLDIGGIAVAIKNLISNSRFRAKIKEEYIKQNLVWYKRYIFYARLWIYVQLSKVFNIR